MQQIVIEAKKRDKLGTADSKRFRKQGLIPAIIYGDNVNESVLLSEKEFTKTLEGIGEHTIITVDVEGKKKDVLVKDYQEDPVSRRLTHIDLFNVNPKKQVKTKVPIHSIGDQPIGVKMGGVLEQYLHSLKIKCLPADIPHVIEIDASHLNFKEGFYIRDLKLDEKIEILHNGGQAIFLVHAARGAELGEEEGEEAEETEASEEASE